MEQQTHLADITTAARLIHQLRGLTSELEALLAQAMVHADAAHLTKTVIAEAAGVTRGRVSQIVTATPSGSSPHHRIQDIAEWPGDALRPHVEGFSGTMTYPPYSRRRASVAKSN